LTNGTKRTRRRPTGPLKPPEIDAFLFQSGTSAQSLKKGRLVVVTYNYAYHLAKDDGEVFFEFPAFPEIISAVSQDIFERMDDNDRRDHATDAVVTALQSAIASRLPLTPGDHDRYQRVSGVVRLNVLQCMKLQLYAVYLANCKTISEFAEALGKHDATVRRMLDLRHRSACNEIEDALARFGKVLVPTWEIEQGPLTVPVRERESAS
jgi:hypothetical protein